MREKFTPEEINFALDNKLSSFYANMPQELKKEILITTDVVEFKRNQIVLEIGQVSNNCYFMIDGFLKSSYINEEKKEVVNWIMGKGEVVISVISYYDQTPSQERVIALRDTLCVQLSYSNWQRLLNTYHEFSLLDGCLTRHYYKEAARQLLWKDLSAQQKWKNITEKYPDLLNEVKLGDIASFLGITRSTLSRVRKGL